MARIRDDGERLIELFAEVSLPLDSTSEPNILWTYPQDYSNKEILNSVPYFAYPCSFKCDVITHFSFVLTNINSKWTFGYCRHTPKNETCLVLLSDLPWHSTFYRVLDHCAVLLTRQSSLPLERYLESLYTSDLPQPGLQLNFTYMIEGIKLEEFSTPCPDHQKLPCIPEDRNITEYFNAISSSNMIAIFASMLHERRIVITSDRLNRLSACVQAANALIYPMHWQHIFIPLLPSHLLDYLSAPMPFLIGVPQTTLSKMVSSELGDIVLLNADTNQLNSPFDDVSTLPTDVLHNLRKSLKQSSAAFGDGLCRAFLRALVSLIGGYHEALRIVPGEKIRFDREAFVSNVRGTSRQLFLEKILQLQIFQQFIEARLDMLNSGEGFHDQFEIELSIHENSSHSRIKAQYREWASTIKKEGGAFLRAVNPKVKSAISRSRQAVRNLRAIIVPPNGSSGVGAEHYKTNSEPSSPKLPPKIKKSISGTAISQTSRTVTYIRTPPSISTSASTTNNKINNPHPSKKSHSRFHTDSSKSWNNGHGIAPAASSESSDIDENDSSFAPRLDMNITAELEDIFRKNSTKFYNTSSDTSSNSSFIPIPPPRADKSRSNSHANKLSPRQEKCLIEFDSPPKESPIISIQEDLELGARLFDPLFESNNENIINNDHNCTNISSSFEANNNNNFSNQNFNHFSTLSNGTKAEANIFDSFNSNPVQESRAFTTEQIISKFELLSAKSNSSNATFAAQKNSFQKQGWQKFD